MANEIIIHSGRDGAEPPGDEATVSCENAPMCKPKGVKQSFLFSDECRALPYYDRLDTRIRFDCQSSDLSVARVPTGVQGPVH